LVVVTIAFTVLASARQPLKPGEWIVCCRFFLTLRPPVASPWRVGAFLRGIAQSGPGLLCYKQLVGKSDPVYSDILAWFTVGDAADAA
jgi:hypothetical protein